MALTFHTLDVFTSEPLKGNPLAVVLEADGLDTARMQAIAREFNISETVFVLKPQNPAHTARVRIFTPSRELPFAGHPTVGTAALLAELRTKQASNDHDALIVLEETVGLVRVGVRLRAGKPPFAEFDAPKLPEEAGTPASPDRLAAALGLIPSEIGYANHKPTRFSAGVAFVFVPVCGLEAMAKAQIQPQHLTGVVDPNSPSGLYLYCGETVHAAAQVHARMFSANLGMSEDPATGSAAAAFAGVVQRFDSPRDGSHKRVIEQGLEMGRESLITLTLEIAQGKAHSVRIGGHAVRMSEGKLMV